ncbi:MAG: metallophosphoesterase family protein [Planctomycetota bacterium]
MIVQPVLKKMLPAAFGITAVLLTACSLTPADVPEMVAPVPPAAERYGVVIIADTQRMAVVEWVTPGGPKERAAVREKIGGIDPHFVLLAGDAVGAGASASSWAHFRRDYHHIPIWPVLGNHELFGPNRTGLRHYFDAFPHVEGRRWYALRFPPLLFLMLDSNFGTMSEEEREEQKAWLRAELDRARDDDDVRGIFLVAHHPPFSVHLLGGDEAVRADFWDPAAEEDKFLGSFSGHHHSYQHIQVGDRHAFVNGGGGGPLLLVQASKLPETARLVKACASPHLLHLVVEDAGVRITMHELQSDDSWKVQDEILLPWPGGD